jgi:hypothetical protein
MYYNNILYFMACHILDYIILVHNSALLAIVLVVIGVVVSCMYNIILYVNAAGSCSKREPKLKLFVITYV